MNNKIIIDQYILYGLNRNRKFLRLPQDNMVHLSNEEDLTRFATKVLEKKDCDSALFFVHMDGTYSSVFKTTVSEELVSNEDEEEESMEITYTICKSERKRDMHFFSWLDGQFRFCCYSLLVETSEGMYEVCV